MKQQKLKKDLIKVHELVIALYLRKLNNQEEEDLQDILDISDKLVNIIQEVDQNDFDLAKGLLANLKIELQKILVKEGLETLINKVWDLLQT